VRAVKGVWAKAGVAPCGLRRGSAAARLLGLWVRIPPGEGMDVCILRVLCVVR